MTNRPRDQLLPDGAPASPRRFGEEPSMPDWPSGAGRFTGPRLGMLAFRRHRWLIILTLACLNGIGVFVMTRLPLQYTAEASVLIGPREAQVMDVKAVISGLSSDTDVLESEIQILHSRRLARSIVVAQKLDLSPEFNPTLAPASFRSWVTGQFHELLETLPQRLRPAEAAPPTQAERERLQAARDPLDHVTDGLLRHLSIAAKGRSRVVGIAVTSGDPVVAADVANGLAEGYINEQLTAKTDATQRAHEWLEKRVAELHQQVIDADTAVENYRQHIGLLQGRNSSLVTEQISDLSQQIILAQSQRANAEARLQAVTSAMASQNGIYNLPEVQQSMVIHDLRAQESRLLQATISLQQIYQSNHPKLAQARSQLEALRGAIGAEVGRIAASLRDEAEVSETREHFLETKMAELGQQVSVGKEGEIQLRSLQQEANADRALYDRLLARAKETQVESGLQQPDAQLISRAEPPDAPSFPNPAVMLPACFVASCLFAVLLILLMESLDHGLSNAEQVERTLGVTALGAVPRLSQRMRRRHSPEAHVLTDATSAYSEALRSLYTSLLLSGSGHPPKVILFASAAPAEGKTTIVLSLARLMATGGKRVVMIDCDTQRPSLHSALKLDRSPGLVECLRDDVEVSSALKKDPMSPALLLPAGQEGHVAPGLFASEAMQSLINQLSADFDLVLLDSAPVLLVSETRALGQLADKTVFIARWQATRREQVAAALRHLVQARGNVAGVLLSMADRAGYVGQGQAGLFNRHVRLYFAR